MQYFIDPTIDFVFKLLLGTPGNENMLIDFINQIINPVSPIISVTYINPYNDKQHEKDKYSVVDIGRHPKNNSSTLLVYASVFCVMPKVTYNKYEPFGTP